MFPVETRVYSKLDSFVVNTAHKMLSEIESDTSRKCKCAAIYFMQCDCLRVIKITFYLYWELYVTQFCYTVFCVLCCVSSMFNISLKR